MASNCKADRNPCRTGCTVLNKDIKPDFGAKSITMKANWNKALAHTICQTLNSETKNFTVAFKSGNIKTAVIHIKSIPRKVLFSDGFQDSG